MTPFWIIDFIEKDSCESFFETYWQSFKHNNPDVVGKDNPDENKFFYFTDATTADITKEKLYSIGDRLALDGEEKRIIPAYRNTEGNRLNVIVLGDLSQPTTRERFHLWTAYVRQQYLQRAWPTFSSVFFHGILRRPNGMCHKVDDNVVGFLNELATLERQNVNSRPFDHVLFVQSTEEKEKRAIVEQTLHMVAYHIARTDGSQLGNDPNRVFFDANATGVFYESDVQKEQDAHSLGQIMLNDFIASKEKEFYDVQEAQEHVKRNMAFVNNLSADGIASALFEGVSGVEHIDIVRPCHPLNPNIVKVWREYYQGYIPSLRRELVNALKRRSVIAEEECSKRMFQNQEDFISAQTLRLQDLVFEMFCNTGEEYKFKHVGLQQCLKVLELFSDAIKHEVDSSKRSRMAFLIPDRLKKAAQKVKENGMTDNGILDVLTTKLSRLPLYNLSRLLRILTLGLLVGALIALFYSPLGYLAIPIVLVIDLLIFNSRVRRIESLKDQYVACKMLQLQQRLNDKADEEIKRTYAQLAKYINWLQVEKIEYLQKNMSTVAPPDFLFQMTDIFQPLVSSTSYEEVTRPRVLIPSHSVSREDLRKVVSCSGSFGSEPLTAGSPAGFIKLPVKGTSYRITSMIDGQKDAVQNLIHSLLKEKREVRGGIEKQVGFNYHTVPAARRMLLLLDISGSMSGESIVQLKEYVNSLSTKGEIEWIAFSNSVTATSRDRDLADLSAVGGTNYIPALQKALEWCNETPYDDIILISDGEPFEPISKIIPEAKKLQQPLNTISISTTAESVLVQLAQATGGTEITVESLQDIQEPTTEEELLPRIVGIAQGTYSFGELMKHSQIIACAEALYVFAIRMVNDTKLSTLDLIEKYGNDKGLVEWLDTTARLGTLKRGVSSQPQTCYLAIASTDADKLTEKMNSLNTGRTIETCDVNPDINVPIGQKEPDMIVSMLCCRPLSYIGDLEWAAVNEDDATITRRNDLLTLVDATHLVNMYNHQIA
ncbi:MAG: VWA domain-containing protein [Bacteroidales bacterium]|nr:VWA domain-containing protein [Bacteroidales bacterium]